MDLVKRSVAAVTDTVWLREGDCIIIPAGNRCLIVFFLFSFTVLLMTSFTERLNLFLSAHETEERDGGLKTVLITPFASSHRLQEDS